MRFAEILKMAFGSLGVNKLRSALTMLGITIGVFSVIGVMTAVAALRGSIEQGLSFLGSDSFQFGKWPTGIQISGNNWRKYATRRDLKLEQGLRYQQLMEGISDVVCLSTSTGGVLMTYGGRQTQPNMRLVGTNEHFLVSNQYGIDTGRNFTAEDVDLGRPVTIIGQDIVQKLFPTESPIGRRITMSQHIYTVIGTLASKGSAFGGTQDGLALVPITRFMSDYGANGRSINIATQAPSQTVYNDTVDKGVTAMRIVRGLKPEDDNDFEVTSNDSLIASFAQIADVIQAGSLAISAIALLAAGVGIMNIMLVSVTERTKEIGIRKSIGARKVSILTQFLVEAVAISLAGGLMGIGLGVAGGDTLALILKASVVFPWEWAGAGLVVCSGIGVAFGFYPALKAASLDPIEALRYE
ncbi:MAG TPA: ABC transporter permease [Opitutaceae bacterium]|nr:ABC transporter permease [Opitutaceae bacterium]